MVRMVMMRRILMDSNPLLMGTHYAVAVGVAFICGFFFYRVTNDISGFQYVSVLDVPDSR
jgi:hypothetical protein